MTLNEDTIYRQTKTARDFWKLLGDPSRLTAEQNRIGEQIRARMTEWDWALEQTCVTASGGCGGPGISIRMAKHMWRLPVFRMVSETGGRSAHWYCRYETAKLFEELVSKSFLEVVPAEEVIAYQATTKKYPLRHQSCYLY